MAPAFGRALKLLHVGELADLRGESEAVFGSDRAETRFVLGELYLAQALAA